MASNIVRSKWVNSRLFTLLLTGTGTATITGPDAVMFTLTDNGAGDYTLTAVTAFTEPPFVSALALTANVAVYQVAPTSTVINIKTNSIGATPAATDSVLQVVVYGSQLLSVDSGV